MLLVLTSVMFTLRDALTKMKDVYVKNPQMGDPASVDPRLSEIAQNIEKLQYEVQKFEVSHVPVSMQVLMLAKLSCLVYLKL